MAWGNIELVSITRAQDYTTIKQNEDNKGVLQQSNLVHSMSQDAEQKAKQVNSSEKPDFLRKKFDAKEKGNGASYENQQDGQKKRHEPEPGQVILKERKGFDIKI